jgi:hypothetical protein
VTAREFTRGDIVTVDLVDYVGLALVLGRDADSCLWEGYVWYWVLVPGRDLRSLLLDLSLPRLSLPSPSFVEKV